VTEVSTRYLIDPGFGVMVGELPVVETHCHHLAQITIALTGLLEVSDHRREDRVVAVAVAPDHPHRVNCEGPVVNLLFDPETPDGRFAASQAKSGLAAIDQAAVHRMNPSLESWAKNQGSADDARRLVLAGLGYEHTSVDLDPRVEAVLARLRGSDRRQIPVADLAHEVHLSPSRLATLFREQVGLPIRRYVL
jgi:AraC-like DNA-binding protein